MVKLSGSNSCAQVDLCRFFVILKQSDHVLFSFCICIYAETDVFRGCCLHCAVGLFSQLTAGLERTLSNVHYEMKNIIG